MEKIFSTLATIPGILQVLSRAIVNMLIELQQRTVPREIFDNFRWATTAKKQHGDSFVGLLRDSDWNQPSTSRWLTAVAATAVAKRPRKPQGYSGMAHRRPWRRGAAARSDGQVWSRLKCIPRLTPLLFAQTCS
jgi:hypothetical protein